MNYNVVALILSSIGVASFIGFAYLGSALASWAALGFFAVCSFLTLWLGDRNQEKEEYADKIEKLEKRVKELEESK